MTDEARLSGDRARTLLGTRIHAQYGTRPDLADLAAWCTSALDVADTMVVAVDLLMHDEVRDRLAPLGGRASVLLVSPWRGTTPALNAILGEASRRDIDRLIIMSREVHASRASLERLVRLVGRDVLVAGARLSEDHGPHPGKHRIDAQTSPWNTLATWNVPLLGLTGFPAIADGRGEVPGGMEEVVTISLLQHLYGDRASAYLVASPGVEWRPRMQDSAHELKMRSKSARAEAHLARMGIPPGRVTVVEGEMQSKRPKSSEAPGEWPGEPE